MKGFREENFSQLRLVSMATGMWMHDLRCLTNDDYGGSTL